MSGQDQRVKSIIYAVKVWRYIGDRQIKRQLKQKVCKICGEGFYPYSSLSKTCSLICALDDVAEKKERNLQQDIKRAEKAVRADIRVRKEKLKSKSDYLREAQTQINKYVRLRDYYLPCISCGIEYSSNKRGGLWDCGHYRSRGSASHLRFNLHNMAKQCVKCNRQLSSNSVEYRKGLIEKIGVTKLEALENNYAIKRFEIGYLIRIKRIFSKKCRILQKRIDNEGS